MYFPLQYPRPYTSAIVFFTFPRYSTAFNPGSEIATVLIQSAKTADHIDISGHTDAQVAGPRDAKIAFGRALAAHNFLVKTDFGRKNQRLFASGRQVNCTKFYEGQGA